jgi:hypothetical protein
MNENLTKEIFKDRTSASKKDDSSELTENHIVDLLTTIGDETIFRKITSAAYRRMTTATDSTGEERERQRDENKRKKRRGEKRDGKERMSGLLLALSIAPSPRTFGVKELFKKRNDRTISS